MAPQHSGFADIARGAAPQAGETLRTVIACAIASPYANPERLAWLADTLKDAGREVVAGGHPHTGADVCRLASLVLAEAARSTAGRSA